MMHFPKYSSLFDYKLQCNIILTIVYIPLYLYVCTCVEILYARARTFRKFFRRGFFFREWTSLCYVRVHNIIKVPIRGGRVGLVIDAARKNSAVAVAAPHGFTCWTRTLRVSTLRRCDGVRWIRRTVVVVVRRLEKNINCI